MQQRQEKKKLQSEPSLSLLNEKGFRCAGRRCCSLYRRLEQSAKLKRISGSCESEVDDQARLTATPKLVGVDSVTATHSAVTGRSAAAAAEWILDRTAQRLSNAGTHNGLLGLNSSTLR